MMPIIAVIIVVIGLNGINFIFWGSVGLARFIVDRKSRAPGGKAPFSKEDVAIIIPAHNEERVIENTLAGVLRIVPAENIHIITSDFEKKDRTPDIARSYGVRVLELPAPFGKARKLEAGISYFDMARRFKAVLFVDADTVLSPDYLDSALPYFADQGVAAVAGHATTLWQREQNSIGHLFFLSYRERFYFFLQLIIKFGQAWKYINVMPIIPGFASIYRSSVLPHITIDAPGLIIEDFNMTFEVHHKKLGRIVYSPNIRGYTQDPDNLRDYFRQVRRWNLGFWQTVYRHGFWPSLFWISLGFYVFEGTMAAIFFLIFPLTLILIFLAYGSDIPYAYEVLIKSVFIGDYILTLIVAVAENRPSFLFYGLGFPFLRFVDSLAYLYSIIRAIFEHSSGWWVSPARR